MCVRVRLVAAVRQSPKTFFESDARNTPNGGGGEGRSELLRAE